MHSDLHMVGSMRLKPSLDKHPGFCSLQLRQHTCSRQLNQKYCLWPIFAYLFLQIVQTQHTLHIVLMISRIGTTTSVSFVNHSILWCSLVCLSLFKALKVPSSWQECSIVLSHQNISNLTLFDITIVLCQPRTSTLHILLSLHRMETVVFWLLHLPSQRFVTHVYQIWKKLKHFRVLTFHMWTSLVLPACRIHSLIWSRCLAG